MSTNIIQGGTARIKAAADQAAPRRIEAVGASPARAAAIQPDVTPSHEKVQAAVKQLQQIAASMDIKLNFKLSTTDNTVVVKVLNRETNEVIREIPPENIRRLADRMAELNGLLFDSRA